MATRLDHLDLMVIQIDGVHMADDTLLVAAIGIDATGEKHPLGLVEGATENAATARALIAQLGRSPRQFGLILWSFDRACVAGRSAIRNISKHSGFAVRVLVWGYILQSAHRKSPRSKPPKAATYNSISVATPS